LNTEIWKPIPEYEGYYEVSSLGRVRSLRTKKLLKLNGVRYVHVALQVDGVREDRSVHKLVLSAFAGPCPAGMLALHWDDVKKNNVLSNLYYGTAEDNCADAARNGARRRGPVMVSGDVSRILDLNRAGFGVMAISRWLGLNRGLVPRVLKGEFYGHRE
jgi:hypothetical protein